MRRSRHGFTLVEIMVTLVMFGVIAAVLTRVLVVSQRTTTTQLVRASLQSNLRVGSMLVPNELRMLAQTDSTDILEVSDTSITYRAMRGYYVLCQGITSANTIKVVRGLPSGHSFDYRAPVAGDSALVFFENDTLKATDDRWVRQAITGTTNGTCTGGPFNGRPALTLTLGGAGVVNATYDWARFLVGSPVRTYEITMLAEMGVDGQRWLGMCVNDASGTCTLQPALGPLAPRDGFKITRYNSVGGLVTGNSFADRTSVRSLKIQVIGVGEQSVNRAGGTTGDFSTIQDTLTTVVTLRNVKQN